MSLISDLEKIPCFKKTFTFSICSGIGAGLATFIFTSRIKRSTDIAVATFAVTTVGKLIHCRYHWTKQRSTAKQLQEALHRAMVNEGKMKPDGPPKQDITSL